MEQIQRFLRRIDRAWRTFGQAPGMIRMGVREDDCSRRDARKPTEPVCSAIDHDAGIIILNEQ